MVAVIGPTFVRIIKPRTHRCVDGNPALADDRGAVAPQAIATGTIRTRRTPKCRFDRAPQGIEFRTFQRFGQIARKAVETIDRFVMRRIDPRVQLDADFGPAVRDRLAQNSVQPRVAGDRIIDEIDRRDPRIFAERLKSRDARHMRQAMAIPLERFLPVEFFLGVDSHDKARAKARRKSHHISQTRHRPNIGANSRLAIRISQTCPPLRAWSIFRSGRIGEMLQILVFVASKRSPCG